MAVNMSYQYTECGLGNVYLKNGYRIDQTEWGEAVVIDHVEDLHCAIGRDIVNSPDGLTGPELRFLRVELNMSQKSLGALAGYKDGQMVAKWEKGEREMPRAVDVVVRALYVEKVIKQSSSNISALLDKLSDHDQEQFHQRRVEFSEQDGVWHADIEAA